MLCTARQARVSSHPGIMATLWRRCWLKSCQRPGATTQDWRRSLEKVSGEGLLLTQDWRRSMQKVSGEGLWRRSATDTRLEKVYWHKTAEGLQKVSGVGLQKFSGEGLLLTSTRRRAMGAADPQEVQLRRLTGENVSGSASRAVWFRPVHLNNYILITMIINRALHVHRGFSRHTHSEMLLILTSFYDSGAFAVMTWLLLMVWA